MNMTNEMWSTIIGGAIALVSGILTTILIYWLRNINAKKAIKVIVMAEVVGVKMRAERYKNNPKNLAAFQSSTPMLTSIAEKVGLLKSKQLIAYRNIIILAMEMAVNGNMVLVDDCISACDDFIKTFK